MCNFIPCTECLVEIDVHWPGVFLSLQNGATPHSSSQHHPPDAGDGQTRQYEVGLFSR